MFDDIRSSAKLIIGSLVAVAGLFATAAARETADTADGLMILFLGVVVALEAVRHQAPWLKTVVGTLYVGLAGSLGVVLYYIVAA